MPTCNIVCTTAAHQTGWGAAFAEGMRRHGWQVEFGDAGHHADMLVLWGVRRQSLIAAQLARGGEVCILERGYIGDRTRWTSVSLGGGLNGRGRFCSPVDAPMRFDAHHAHLLRPWRAPRQGGYALLIGQVATDQALRGVDIVGWYEQMSSRLHEVGYDVMFRPHPHAARRGGVYIPARSRLRDPETESLIDALSDAAVCVTYNSNSAVESVLYGRPTYAEDEGSMAWDVTSRTLSDVAEYRPERRVWAERLAWCQYEMDEIRSGYAWDIVAANGGWDGR